LRHYNVGRDYEPTVLAKVKTEGGGGAEEEAKVSSFFGDGTGRGLHSSSFLAQSKPFWSESRCVSSL